MGVRDEEAVLGWLAYHTDWSGMKVFYEEIDALRYAISNHMEVMSLRDGEEIR